MKHRNLCNAYSVMVTFPPAKIYATKRIEGLQCTSSVHKSSVHQQASSETRHLNYIAQLQPLNCTTLHASCCAVKTSSNVLNLCLLSCCRSRSLTHSLATVKLHQHGELMLQLAQGAVSVCLFESFTCPSSTLSSCTCLSLGTASLLGPLLSP